MRDVLMCKGKEFRYCSRGDGKQLLGLIGGGGVMIIIFFYCFKLY